MSKPKHTSENHRKIALITGASSGIGSATALKFARAGLMVVLVARRLNRLEILESEIRETGGKVKIIQADLTDDTQRLGIYQRVIEDLDRVDILVNNAGLGWYGYYANMPWHIAQELLQLNITAVAHLTNLFLPGMRKRDSGHIINIGSIAGGFPNQGVAIYSASKSFLDAFTTVLHRELRGSNVSCSVVRVGPVRTEFFERAKDRPAGLPVPAERFAITPDRVADRIWDLVQSPSKAIYIPRYYAITPWIELLFGWVVDRLGPLLLRRASATR